MTPLERIHNIRLKIKELDTELASLAQELVGQEAPKFDENDQEVFKNMENLTQGFRNRS